MPFGNRKKCCTGTFQFVIATMRECGPTLMSPQFKKYYPSEKLKFNNLDIFQSLKSRILMEISLSISLKLNFTPNTSGRYRLRLPSLISASGME